MNLLTSVQTSCHRFSLRVLAKKRARGVVLTPHPGPLPVEGCSARTNPKSETRNPKQAPNSNDKFSKPDQSARPRRLGFEDLLLCSLEFVSDFGFRILPAILAKPAVSSRGKCGARPGFIEGGCAHCACARRGIVP